MPLISFLVQWSKNTNTLGGFEKGKTPFDDIKRLCGESEPIMLAIVFVRCWNAVSDVRLLNVRLLLSSRIKIKTLSLTGSATFYVEIGVEAKALSNSALYLLHYTYDNNDMLKLHFPDKKQP